MEAGSRSLGHQVFAVDTCTVSQPLTRTPVTNRCWLLVQIGPIHLYILLREPATPAYTIYAFPAILNAVTAQSDLRRSDLLQPDVAHVEGRNDEEEQ